MCFYELRDKMNEICEEDGCRRYKLPDGFNICDFIDPSPEFQAAFDRFMAEISHVE